MNDSLGMPQTAVVLGGTSDIARALLRALAVHRLSHVLLAGRDGAGLDATAKELEALGVEDVQSAIWDANDADHERLAEEAVSRLGSIDMVIVAAGVLGDQERCESEADAVASVLRTNFTSLATAITAFAKVLRRQGHGRIVVFSSVAGVRIRRSNYVYGASKAGLDSFAQGLAEALRPAGVQVMIVRPGWVGTSMTAGLAPGPMATTPDAVAADVVKGLERGSTVVWSPAPLRLVFGVLKLLPAAIWRRMPA